MNNREVSHIWARNANESAAGSNFYCQSGTIYSYGPHFPIARFVTDKTGAPAVLLTTRGYSNTTARHISYAYQAVPSYIPVYRVKDPAAVPGEPALAEYLTRIREAAGAVTAARRESTRERYQLQLDSLKHEAANFAAAFLPRRLTKAEQALLSTDTPAADTAAALKRLADKAAKAERARIERARADQIKQEQADLTRWLSDSTFRRSFYNLQETCIRLSESGLYIETTRGAYMDIKPARLLYRLICSGREIPEGETFDRYRAAYNSNKLQIGCHVITRAEIDRFAAAVGWTGGE